MGEDLGGVEGEEIVIKVYCIKFYFLEKIKSIKKDYYYSNLDDILPTLFQNLILELKLDLSRNPMAISAVLRPSCFRHMVFLVPQFHPPLKAHTCQRISSVLMRK